MDEQLEPENDSTNALALKRLMTLLVTHFITCIAFFKKDKYQENAEYLGQTTIYFSNYENKDIF